MNVKRLALMLALHHKLIINYEHIPFLCSGVFSLAFFFACSRSIDIDLSKADDDFLDFYWPMADKHCQYFLADFLACVILNITLCMLLLNCKIYLWKRLTAKW